MSSALRGRLPRRPVVAVAVAVIMGVGIAEPTMADSVSKTIPLGDYVTGAAVTTDGSRLLVTRWPNLLDVVSTSTDSVMSTITAGDNPRDIEFSPDGTRAYVPNYGDNSVSVVNTTTMGITSTIPVGTGNPTDIALSPTRSVAYVTKTTAGTVAVVDLQSGTVTRSIAVGNSPNSVVFTPDGSRAFVANYASDTVSIIDASSDTVVGTTAVGDEPFSVGIAPDAALIYVTNYGSKSLTVLNPASGATVGSPIALAGQPLGLDFTPNGARALVATRNPSAVEFIDVASGASTGSLALASGPVDVAIMPNAQKAYVTNFFAFSVSVIDLTAAPGAPSAISGIPGDNEVALTWDSPSDPGGAPITGYRIEQQTDGGAWSTVVANTGSTTTAATVGGLTNGTGYRFRLTAINSAGPGAASAASALLTPRTTPGAPSAVSSIPGNGKVELAWAAPTGDGGSAITGYRIEAEANGGPWTTAIADTGTTSTNATVTGLTNGTSYRFRISAINSAGAGIASAPSIAVIPNAIPSPPTGVSVTPGNAEVQIAWTVPAEDGGSPITGYRVEAEANGGPWTTAIADTGTTSTNATMTGLTNGTSYRFRVSAINSAGAGPASQASAPVTPRTTPGAPTGLNGTPGNTHVTLTWTAPADTGGASITGYRIESKTGDGEWTQQIASTGSATTSANVTGLTNGTDYTFRVSAINSAGAGPASQASAPVTPRTTPGAPTGLNGTPGNTHVTLTWTAPADTGGASITGYRIDVQPTGGSWATSIADTNSPATSVTVNGLVNGTEYRFRVSSINSAGAGSASSASDPLTPRTVPGSALNVQAEPADQQVALTWSAPSSNGGAAISGYRVEKKVGSAQWAVAITNTGTPATTAVVDGLTNGVEHQFRVSALNEAGAGPASDATSTVTPRTVPGAPTNVQGTPGNGQVALSWNAPVSDGGSTVNGYRIEIKAGDTAWTVARADTGSSATTTTLSGLTNGQPYRFRVAALNAAGAGSTSAQSDPVTPVTVPGSPTALMATPTDEAVELTWAAPGDTGGSPITGYRVEMKTGDSAWVPHVSDTGSVSTHATISGLTNGTEYRFRISAINAAGPGLPSSATDPVTPRTTPGTPTDLTGTPGDRFIDLDWTAPVSTGGSPISGYRVERKAGAEEWDTVVADTASSATSIRIGTLTNGISYRFRVSALNAAGVGSPSNPTGALVPRTTPSAPTALQGMAGDESVRLEWTAPSDAGGVPITGYRIEMRVGSGNWTVQASDTGSDATAATVSGLSNGVGYRFRVTARNEAGLGETSNATTELFPFTTPGPPRAVDGIPGDGLVELRWQAPANDGGSPITGYRIDVRASGGSWTTAIADTKSTATSTIVSALENGRAYAFRVAAMNAAGVGTPSAPSPEVTPTQAPSGAGVGTGPTPKAKTSVNGWPARVKAKRGKARLTVEISPAAGRLAIVQQRICTRKAGKTKCRWVQSNSRQLPAAETAVIKVALKAGQKKASAYRLVLPETQNADAATTRPTKVLPARK